LTKRFNTIGRALHGAIGDRQVVPEDAELADASSGEIDLARVGDAHFAPAYLECDRRLVRCHGRSIQR